MALIQEITDAKSDAKDGDKENTDSNAAGNTDKRSWKLVVANVGDSRCLIVRADGEIVEMTTDHKPADDGEKERIIAAGAYYIACMR